MGARERPLPRGIPIASPTEARAAMRLRPAEAGARESQMNLLLIRNLVVLFSIATAFITAPPDWPTSPSPLGAAAGAMTAGRIADHVGRLFVMKIAAVLFFISALGASPCSANP